MKKLLASGLIAAILTVTTVGPAAVGQELWEPFPPAGNITGNVTGNINGNIIATGNVTDVIASIAGILAIHDNMRLLWEQHILWTRQVVVDVAADLPSLTHSVERLLKNQEDIGNAIKPYYGEAAGNNLTDLLKTHITVAAEILNAAKAGNQTALAAANATWYANAFDIAVFLNTANPTNWASADVQAMLEEHLALLMEEATARFNGDYAADAVAFDKTQVQILKMADVLSHGIMAQFPDKFIGTIVPGLMGPEMMVPGMP